MVAMLRQAAITSAANPPAEDSRFITNHALLPAGGVAGRTPIDGPAIQAMMTFGVQQSDNRVSSAGGSRADGLGRELFAGRRTSGDCGQNRHDPQGRSPQGQMGGPMNVEKCQNEPKISKV